MSAAPLAIDLYCGLGGWAQGLLAEGWDVVGFDIERHAHRYPGQLVLQDVLTLHGSQFRDAALIVASPPCQAYSYRAMPWKRAKALPPPDNTLFDVCFRIQREACWAAQRHIPVVVENVRGAQKWVGRARWNYGSYYLWGDVPVLMPSIFRGPRSMNENKKPCGECHLQPDEICDICWAAECNREDAIKAPEGTRWFNDGPRTPQSLASSGSKSSARKAASAMIARIPLPLARHIGRVFRA